MSAHGHGTSLKNLYFILISTFIFGFIAGVILYLQNNTGKEGDGAIQEVAKGFTIQAHMYGGCERVGCPSYQISNNGSFVFIGQKENPEETKYQNTLPPQQLEILKEQLSKTNFTDIIHTKFNGICPSVNANGVAYRFEIEYTGERFAFDSCVQELANVPLMSSLKNYFEIFNTLRASQK